MWHDSVLFFFWFCLLRCTVRLLFDSFWRGWGKCRLKLDVQGLGGGKILGVDEKGIGGKGSWKLDNFHGHICVSQLIDKTVTAWKLSKYGPKKPPYLDTFQAVRQEPRRRKTKARYFVIISFIFKFFRLSKI